MKMSASLLIVLSAIHLSLSGCKEPDPIVTPPTSTVKLIVPPNPGDLSFVKHLKQSDDYTVEVKKSGDKDFIPCFVYKTDNYASNMYGGEHRPQTAASFTNFSFKGTSVDVRITTKYTASSIIIRPLNYNITPVQNGNVITFTLTSPKKISIEVNNRLNPLFVFADAPDVPNTGATYYYGPGVHNVGLGKTIRSNESVYIAGGAVVEGTFRIPDGSTNVEVRGRGIISNGSLPTLEQHGVSNDSLMKYSTFSGADKYQQTSSKSVRFEGIVIANSGAWNFALSTCNYSNSNNSWRNIKEISWSGCTDGIWFDGDNNIIDDCFIFNNDDVVTTHGSRNCTISNSTFWGGNFGRIFMHTTFASSTNITFNNINVIGHDSGPCLFLFEAATNTAATSMQNFTFKDIRVENHPYNGKYNPNKFIIIDQPNSKISNWLFENLTIDEANVDEGDIYGSSSGLIDGFTFRNFMMNGTKVTSISQAKMDINGFVSNVNFE